MKEEWNLIDVIKPEESDKCSWYDSKEMKFTTVWVTIEDIKTGHRYTEQKNRLLMKIEPNNFKTIPEKERVWIWSVCTPGTKIIAWMPFNVPKPYTGE